MEGIPQFLRGQFSTPSVPQVDLTGQTIIVTGANSGLGLDAAKLLVQLNCSTVVLACRNLSKGETAKEEVQSVSSKNGQKSTVIVMELDMSSFSNVEAFAQRCKDLPRVDAAILNAGVFLEEFTLTEGYETTITVNVISTFLLATLLVPIMRQSAKAHNITPKVAITGSAVHFWAKEKNLTNPKNGQILKTLSDPEKTVMKGTGRYNLSKLPVMLLVKYLASLLTKSAHEDSNGKPLVIINNVAPGLCKTPLFAHQDAVASFAINLVGRPSEHGARTLVHGAVAGKETHGQYLSECEVKKYSSFVKSAEGDQTARRIWDELSVIYETVKPGCTKVF